MSDIPLWVGLERDSEANYVVRLKRVSWPRLAQRRSSRQAAAKRSLTPTDGDAYACGKHKRMRCIAPVIETTDVTQVNGLHAP